MVCAEMSRIRWLVTGKVLCKHGRRSCCAALLGLGTCMVQASTLYQHSCIYMQSKTNTS